MLYEEPIHELAEQVGGDLYILPSSVHEVIAVPADFDSPEELAEMVYEINMEQVDINDRLSNQVYHYDRDLRTLRLATDTINKSLDDVDLGARENTERGCRPSGNFSIIYFQAGKTDHEEAEEGNCKV